MPAEIQRAVPDVQVVPSYTLINDSELPKESRMREEVDRAGLDGAIFLRVTDVDRNDVYVPGRVEYAPEYYRTFWGYYRTGRQGHEGEGLLQRQQ